MHRCGINGRPKMKINKTKKKTHIRFDRIAFSIAGAIYSNEHEYDDESSAFDFEILFFFFISFCSFFRHIIFVRCGTFNFNLVIFD